MDQSRWLLVLVCVCLAVAFLIWGTRSSNGVNNSELGEGYEVDAGFVFFNEKQSYCVGFESLGLDRTSRPTISYISCPCLKVQPIVIYSDESHGEEGAFLLEFIPDGELGALESRSLGQLAIMVNFEVVDGAKKMQYQFTVRCIMSTRIR